MERVRRKIRFSKGMMFGAFFIIALIAMVGVVVGGILYKRQCDNVYDEVNASIVESGMKLYGEYNGQNVEISQQNINYIINSVTSRMVTFSSANKMPSVDPVILQFGDSLLMEVYPEEDYKVFIKHRTDKKTKYYYIDDTCNFSNLIKMVSVDEWSYPNIVRE